MPVGKKFAAGGVVLAAGLIAALCFRKAPEDSPAGDDHGTPVGSIERRLTTQGMSGPAVRRAFKVPTAATGIVESAGPQELPPSFHRTFSPVGALLKPLDPDGPELTGDRDDSAAAGREPGDRSPRTHKIQDGDTLSKLAARYLGSSDRCLEIYELNRGVLSNPDLLPIGVELKIPPAVAQASDEDVETLPLVPVPQ